MSLTWGKGKPVRKACSEHCSLPARVEIPKKVVCGGFEQCCKNPPYGLANKGTEIH